MCWHIGPRDHEPDGSPAPYSPRGRSKMASPAATKETNVFKGIRAGPSCLERLTFPDTTRSEHDIGLCVLFGRILNEPQIDRGGFFTMAHGYHNRYQKTTCQAVLRPLDRPLFP